MEGRRQSRRKARMPGLHQRSMDGPATIELAKGDGEEGCASNERIRVTPSGIFEMLKGRPQRNSNQEAPKDVPRAKRIAGTLGVPSCSELGEGQCRHWRTGPRRCCCALNRFRIQ